MLKCTIHDLELNCAQVLITHRPEDITRLTIYPLIVSENEDEAFLNIVKTLKMLKAEDTVTVQDISDTYVYSNYILDRVTFEVKTVSNRIDDGNFIEETSPMTIELKKVGV